MGKSGQVRLDGDTIRYRSTLYGDWDLPVPRVRVVGEATNDHGPFADDYFFCFATGPDEWLEASFYADGRDDFLRALGARLGARLETGLCHSTDFASRVLWPPSLVGEPMFKFTELPPKGLLRRLLRIGRKMQTWSEPVAALLARQGQELDR